MTIYALSTFLGAFLLFFCQPMMGRFLLPWFGGGAAVWTAALLFFQVGLVVGYAYAHLLSRWSGRVQVLVHCGLLALAWCMLDLVPSQDWRPAPGGDPLWATLRLLAQHVGLPYVLLSATAPLIQSWFGRVHPGRSPYGLYALSNLAAVFALFGYPFVFEPAWTRQMQAQSWSIGFAALTVAFVLGGVGMWSVRAYNPASSDTDRERETGLRPIWFVLPALSSALLLAVTNRLTENVPPFPFLWVLPLALHLGSFVVCFRARSLYRRGPTAVVFAIGVGLLAWQLQVPTPKFLGQMVLLATVLFSACLLLHGELYRLRPSTQRLTAYYLAIAVGGALGGAFVAVLAPALFDRLYEFPLLLIATSFAVLWLFAKDPNSKLSGLRPRWAWLFLGSAWSGLVGYLGVQEFSDPEKVIHRSRNFFGTQAVVHLDAGQPRDRYYFRHGVVTHGTQFLADGFRHLPTAYFTAISGVGLAWNSLPSDGPVTVGVIGLGAGTLAAYGKPGDRIRFYEIDPKVVAVARDVFFYLADSEASIDVIVGDGRASLEREEPQGFDLLVLDAFSGDAPPAHLLTIEAFEIYRRHLKRGGIIAVNVTNRYLDLLNLIATQAQALGMKGVWVSQGEDITYSALKSTWVLLSEEGEALQEQTIRSVANPLEDYAGRCSVWTDEFSAPMEVLNWH